MSKTITSGGNGVVTEYSYDDMNELLVESVNGVASAVYAYDLNGNTLSNDGDGLFFSYDVANRLIQVDDSNTWSTIFTAAYDYRTRRVSKTENGETTFFRYDGGTSFQELDDAGDMNVEFVRGGSGAGMGGGIGSILYSDRTMASGGGPVEFYTYNVVGHTAGLTSEAGEITNTNTYEAFGNIVTSSGQSDNNRLANTKERDASLGLDNHGFRYYDPSTGRYLTRDPIGYADGMNPYLSVHNNPINHIDPLGLFFSYAQNWWNNNVVRPVAHTVADAVSPMSPKSAYAIRVSVETAVNVSNSIVGMVDIPRQSIESPVKAFADYNANRERGLTMEISYQSLGGIKFPIS